MCNSLISKLSFLAFWILFSCTSNNPKEKIQSTSTRISTTESNSKNNFTFSDVIFTDMKGEVKKIDPNRLTFLNLWATWCKPCIEEMPSMSIMMNKLNTDYTFLFASYESRERIQAFIKKTGHTLPFYSYDESAVPQEMNVQLLPVTFIIKNNKVIYTKTGATDWSNDSVIKHLNELTKKY